MINRVILVGHVGGDPETTEFSNGSSITVFSLATKESWKDKATGEKKDRTTWHRIVVQGEHLQKIAEDYVEKGSKVYIEGNLAMKSWKDKNTGEDKKAYEISVRGFSGKLVTLDKSEGGYRDEAPPEEAYGEE